MEYFLETNYLKRLASISLRICRQHRSEHEAWNSLDFNLERPSDGQGENKKFVGEYFDSYAADVPLVFRNCLENTLIYGYITDVNCKVFGLTYAANIVYST